MAAFVDLGGCYNASRVAKDGAGAGSRDWQAAADTVVTGWRPSWRLIFATSWDGADMDNYNGDFQLQWRNDDGGTFAVLASTGEVKWATDTDLVDGATVVAGEHNGANNCSGMLDGIGDGEEVEGDDASTTYVGVAKLYFDIQWAVDMSGATAGDTYEFRVVETGTSNVQSDDPCTTTVKMAENNGTIDGITSDIDGSVLISCHVSLFEVTSEGPPHEYEFVESQISHGTTGAYSFEVWWDGTAPYHMVYSSKDDTPHVFDATDNVVQPA
jgi:hypothetical protein